MNKLFLDADSSIIEKNLKIVNDPEEEEFEKFLHQTTSSLPCKTVKPRPGFCIKSRELGTDKKLFVNICQTDAIPPPKDISEQELAEILESEDPSEFRVPMSIGDVRTETDKQGNEAKAVDIAINPDFFTKIENNFLFKDFLIAVIFEGIKNKHNIFATDERVLLKNRKAYGNLQLHRIQQRDIERKMGKMQESEQSLLDRIRGGYKESENARPMIETITSTDYENIMTGTKKPLYRLYKRKDDPNVLIGEFKFPDVLKTEELTLDLGEDRILLECKSRNYLLDIFLPCSLDQEEAASEFNINSKILTVTMPIKSVLCSET